MPLVLPTGRSLIWNLSGNSADTPEVYEQALPVMYVNQTAPPLRFLHRPADTTLSVDQSRVMMKRLCDSRVEVAVQTFAALQA